MDLKSSNIQYVTTPFTDVEMFPVTEKGLFDEMKRVTTLSLNLIESKEWLKMLADMNFNLIL